MSLLSVEKWLLYFPYGSLVLSLALLCGHEAQYPVVGIVIEMEKKSSSDSFWACLKATLIWQHVPVGPGSRKCQGLLHVFCVMPFFFFLIYYTGSVSAHCLLQSFTEPISAVWFKVLPFIWLVEFFQLWFPRELQKPSRGVLSLPASTLLHIASMSPTLLQLMAPFCQRGGLRDAAGRQQSSSA